MLKIPPGPFRRALLAWYRRNGRHDLLWRQTRDPYAILVSEIMLQQTQVATVRSYYIEWLRRFPDFASLAAAPESAILRAWEGLGYYTRARNLHAAAKIIAQEHGGVFPTSIEEMRKLPGVGRYTANAVAAFAFDQSIPVVEANIARLLARISNLKLRIDSAPGSHAVWRHAADLLPAKKAGVHNSALMDLGALVCVSGEPKCGQCPVRRFCLAQNPASLPRKRLRPALKRVTEHHRFATKSGLVLLEESRTRWRGMWILPRLDSLSKKGRLLHTAEFPFTHHRVTLAVFGSSQPRRPTSGQRWFAPDELRSLPLPTPHRRALERLIQRSTL